MKSIKKFEHRRENSPAFLNHIIYLALVLSLTSFSLGASQSNSQTLTQPYQISDRHLIKYLAKAQHRNKHLPVDLKLHVFDCGEILVRDITTFNPALTANTHCSAYLVA